MKTAALHFLVLTVAGWMSRHQNAAIKYLRAENQVLREQLGGRRLKFSDRQRRLLGAKGKALGRKALRAIATVAAPDTVLLWYRELVAKKYGAPGQAWCFQRVEFPHRQGVEPPHRESSLALMEVTT